MSVALNGDALTVGGRIRWVRQNAKSNIKNFAQELGISANYLSILEHGRRPPSDQLLRKIAEVGGASYQWLKDGEDAAKRTTQVTPCRRLNLTKHRISGYSCGFCSAISRKYFPKL